MPAVGQVLEPLAPNPAIHPPHLLCRVGWFFYCSDGDSMYPYCTGLDVVAHELAHGITSLLNGGLFYYGQAGGWNGDKP